MKTLSKTLKVISTAVAVLLAVTAAPVLGQSPPYLSAKSSVVLVETSGGTGSGFAVSPGLVATACHVVKGAAAIQVHFWAAKVKASGRQVSCDEKGDIAFIGVAVPEGTTLLTFADARPTQGQQIWVWGYPLGTRIALEPSVAAGIVSATETAQGFVALNVSGAPGSSGGPVIDAEGKVIGVMVAAWVVEGHGSTGFKYAAPASAATAILAGQSTTPPPAPPQAVADAPAASIRPGQGIGPVKLGMTPAEVQQAIGLPPTRVSGGGWYIWETRKMDVLFLQGRAFLIDTEDPRETTSEGIRIGSSDVELIQAYGRPMCASVREFRDKAYLGWYYDGLFVFLNGSPRKAFGIRVLPGGSASQVCR
jgi:hypothetical protein